MRETRRRFLKRGGLFGVFLLSAGLAIAAPIRVTDARGKVFTLSGPPKRIVSIAPSNTEILYALGLGPKIVGVTDYCDYPADTKNKPKVGGVVLNDEKIVSLKPDLVVAFYDLQKANIPKLERLGLRVFAVDPHSVGEVMTAIRSLGAVTGASVQAARVIRKMQGELRMAGKVAVKDHHKPKTLVVIQNKPLIVTGPRTFINDALGLAGASNVAGDAKQSYPQFSMELAVARKPEVLLLSAAKPDQILNDPAWKSTPAVQSRRVYSPAFMAQLERPGPRITGAILQLAKLLHPSRP